MNIPNCISKCLEETNFFNDQKKLDTMYYLMKGKTYGEVANQVEKEIHYVQRVMNFLERNELLHWGRWSPNVYKIGMKKSIAFLSWKQRKLPVSKKRGGNFKYATYVHYVRAEKTKVLVIYTYPKEDEPKIRGKKGEPITPFYYTDTRFTVPFFKKINLVKEFFDEFGSVDNTESVLIGTPSFDEDDKTHPIIVYICRYCELLSELSPGILKEYFEHDFRDYTGDIDISYENIEKKLNWMIKNGVIFPRNALHLKPLSYQSTLFRISTKEIYKIMGTFNKFNMLTRLALTRNKDEFYLYLQYPFYQFPDVMQIVDRLDPNSRAYIETKYVMGDTIYYQWSLEKFLKSRS